MTISEELEIVEQAKSNIQAFNAIYEFYVSRIYSYCLSRLSSKEMAQDLTSQVFLAAIEGIDKFDTNKGIRFGAWLYRTANNKIIDSYRKKKTDLITEEEEQNVTDQSDSLDQQAQRDFVKKRISSVLLTLKPEYQEVISLRYFSELEIIEIADALKIKPNNVSVLLHRALKSFREKHAKYYPESEIFDLL